MKNFIKKKIFICIAILVMAAFVVINLNFVSNQSGSSNLSLTNAEALASGELFPYGWDCFQNIRDNGGELFFIVTYCGDCSSYSATSVIDPNHCWFVM